MNIISLIFSIIVLLAISWILGTIATDKILSLEQHKLRKNPVIILLVGAIVLILICLLCKL
jgi:cbb3-type cytochrome oxidase subunit 1